MPGCTRPGNIQGLDTGDRYSFPIEGIQVSKNNRVQPYRKYALAKAFAESPPRLAAGMNACLTEGVICVLAVILPMRFGERRLRGQTFFAFFSIAL